MAIEDRGFASMDRNKQREIASKGGRAAHKKGAAHEWTREEAQAAGRKGGLARHRRPDDTLTSDDTSASTLPPVASTSESSSIDER
jgi:general stress protein YciG